ncbi:peptidoglycan D,D-transpeptidase FtsI family protein [Thiocapsa marina]|uniref:Peptidoglycan glycosyltransferase n=1 Tax=Thiocapsa marina 5811 TaxID=768671 RepID=F9U6L2_9GAMM|nr:penicillin-binding transpeptidase domain-containing protein [Thiocapsa marina]EGV19888.1 Peptidoglycan glycosyltransferase [Thiocapsa marina 5811]
MTTHLNPETWSLIRVALHVGFFFAAAYLLRSIFNALHATELRHLPRAKWSVRVPIILLTLLFTGILVYQATWQLIGASRPQFIAFMQLHDRRELNPAHRIQRGRILDHRGEVLAYSEEILGEVYRLYPDGPAFTHVVGYSHPWFGASGMESVATVRLNGGAPDGLGDWGTLGRQIVTQDKRPRGQDLRLTLDAELQRMAFGLLEGRQGAIVILRPVDGAIRTLVSAPSYDPNRITPALFQDSAPGAALLNRATQGLYPPGSTFKILLAASALEQGFSGTLECPADGFTTSPRYRKIRDHEYYTARKSGSVWRGQGRLDLATAFARSSNVFFAQLGVRFGHDVFYAMTDRMQFNRRIILHETPYGAWSMRTGEIPRLDPSDRYGLAQMSIGQGAALVTPAHMALIAGAVANRGLAVRPRLIETDEPAPLAYFMSSSVAERLSAMLRQVVLGGTGRGIETPRLAIAGKTGTAENPHGSAHSWFVGFAPADRPQLAVAVLVEHGGYGSATAAPMARDLLLRAIDLGLIE